MRATYQLNTEKLEYNYRVLTERDNENTSTLQKQKKKLTKIKDDLSKFVSKYHKDDAFEGVEKHPMLGDCPIKVTVCPVSGGGCPRDYQKEIVIFLHGIFECAPGHWAEFFPLG